MCLRTGKMVNIYLRKCSHQLNSATYIRQNGKMVVAPSRMVVET